MTGVSSGLTKFQPCTAHHLLPPHRWPGLSLCLPASAITRTRPQRWLIASAQQTSFSVQLSQPRKENMTGKVGEMKLEPR